MASEAFRLFVSGVRDHAIFMLDTGGRVATWNEGAERMKGYRADEIIGRHFSIFYPPEDVERGKPAFALQLAADTGQFVDEAPRVRKDGTRFWANVVITAVRGLDGTLLGYGKLTRDVTQRRRAEEERLRLAAKEEALRVREEFLALAGHELRTPIAALQLQAELVLRLAEADRPQPLHHLAAGVRQMRHSAARLQRLVDAVLRMGRLSDPDAPLARQAVEVRAALARVIEDYRIDAEQSRCVVKLVDGVPATAVCDPGLLDILVGNLVSNAIKYGRGKPVTLSIENAQGVVRVAVRDEGIGIPP
jgi:PAS domain S-box-containing protein